MKRSFVNVPLAALLMCGCADALAGEAVDKSLAVRSGDLVRIGNVRGRIEVVGWERDEVTVKGTLDDQAESLTFETVGATTMVKVVTPANLSRGEGSDLVIHVPRASRVNVDVVSTDLSLKDLRADIDVKGVSGSIDGDGIDGRVDFTTVSGNIDVERFEGPTKLSTVGGGIDADVDAEVLTIATISGHVQARSTKPLRELTLHSVSGDIEVRADLADGVRVAGSTTSGDIRLIVNREASAIVDLTAVAGGGIVNTLTDDVPQRSRSGGADLQMTLGTGSGSVELTTVSGTLELLAR